MPRLTAARAALAALLVAVVVHLGALDNQWALDDYRVIERNPAAHAVSGALSAAFSPYWPPEPEGFSAGLYRPLVILSYAVDWVISGAQPWWFHLVNVLLHGVATALVVAVALAWLPPAGALAAGLIFAVHPVHVEAVANVVGRAEVLAAIGMLGAILAARRYRQSSGILERRTWLAVTLATTLAALLSKEHAVVTIVLLALDHALTPAQPGAPAVRAVSAVSAVPPRAPMGPLYLAVTWLTVAWLFLWNGVAGALVTGGAVTTFGTLSAGERIVAMLPVQLEVMRLLAWPARLAADYGPQTIPFREQWGLAASVALVSSLAVLALAVAVRRAAPGVAFGILSAAATYAPTSNLLFLSGVVLAERNLYLAVLAPALGVGWAVARAAERGRGRAAAMLLAAVVLAAGVRTAARVPFWRDSRTVVIESVVDQPENIQARTRLARSFELSGEIGRAIAEYAAAGAIFERYAAGPAVAARLALSNGQPRMGLDLARRARHQNPSHAGIVDVLAEAFLANGQADSAEGVVRDLVRQNPGDVSALESYLTVLERTRAPAWQHLLARARLDWRHGRPVAATARLDSAGSRIPWPSLDADGCWELQTSLELMHTLTRDLRRHVERQMEGRCR